MPDWTNYYFSYDTGTSFSSQTAAQIQQEFEEYQYQRVREQQMWAEHQELMDKLDRQAEEEAEDRQKYPLFFLKEGIV